MAGQRILAVDLGAGSGRVFQGSLTEAGLELEELHRFPNNPVEIRRDLLWNIFNLYEGIKQGLLKAASLYHPREFASLGISSWAVDFGLLDRQGRLVDSVFHYRDSRTMETLDLVRETMEPLLLYRLTGSQFARFNTLCQLTSLKRFRPWVLEGASSLLMIGELFTYFLTEARIAEWTNATTTQLCALEDGNWSEQVFDVFGLPRKIMPPIVSAGTVVGTLTEPWASGAGLKHLTVRVPGVHDTASAVAAVPAGKGPSVFISSGTWSLVGTVLKEPLVSRDALKLNFANEGAIGGGYRFLRNVQGMWLLQQCLSAWREMYGPMAWEDLLVAARGVKASQGLIDPDAAVFYEPGDMPGRINAFLAKTGQPAAENPAQMVRIILESLSLKYRWVVESIQDLTGLTFTGINIVGGGSRNGLLNAMVADCTGLTVTAGPAEATVLGNVLTQAVSAGLIGSLSEGKELIRKSGVIGVYEPRDRSSWNCAYSRFLQLTSLNQGVT
jgi:rhamnulokinase